MCRQAKHSPILCILPPHILRSLAQNGSPQERSHAMSTLAADLTFRTLRLEQVPLTRAGRRGQGVLGEEGRKQRSIYDAKGSQELPGTLVRAEGSAASGDPAVDEAYDGLGATFDFFWETYERNSIDDEGLPLTATVHFGQNYENAFWDGKQMVFGDGDGQLFNRFTSSLDVIGHELAHGVTQDESRLAYSFQPGALNESLSDVFGSLVKQRKLNQTADQADWLIGAELLTDQVKGVALRSMKDPGTAYDDPVLGKDPQPAHMRDFLRTYEDNGGVHINSGIPNRAFYLAASEIGGYAWERAGRIWYETLRDPQLRSNTGFRRFARLTVTVAGRLYGEGGAEQTAVRRAWGAVGLPVT